MNDKDNILKMERARFAKMHEPVEAPALTETEYAIMGGKSARLDIPLTSTHDLRAIPELFRGAAQFVEFTLNRRELDERQRLSMIGTEMRTLRARIREIAGAGKFNKNGTVKR